jgi:Bacterial regulatory proteins, lacI family
MPVLWARGAHWRGLCEGGVKVVAGARTDLTQDWLWAIRKDDDYGKGRLQTYGGDHVALRAYRHWHPAATVYNVSYNGRTFWLTGKQLLIWQYAHAYWRRGRHTTLADIAKLAHCSRATVSRFLKRLDFWRVVDVATLRGRAGGVYILTVQDRKWQSKQSRRTARARIAQTIRRLALNRLKPLLLRYRLPPPPWRYNPGGWKGEQLPALVVSTDATLQ